MSCMSDGGKCFKPERTSEFELDNHLSIRKTCLSYLDWDQKSRQLSFSLPQCGKNRRQKVKENHCSSIVLFPSLHTQYGKHDRE